MHYTKVFTILALSLAVGFLGCTTDKKVEAPTQEQITKTWFHRRLRSRGRLFL